MLSLLLGQMDGKAVGDLVVLKTPNANGQEQGGHNLSGFCMT